MTILETAKKSRFSEPHVRVIIEQVLLSLDFFQRKRIVHRDIKLENILISSVEDHSEYEIRIADFGLAIFTSEDEKVTGKCGSPGYVAPEVFKSKFYDYRCDIFSLGSVMYQLLTGEYLFDGESAKEIIKRNIECNLSYAVKQMKSMSAQCRDLMLWMLEADPDNRATAKQALKHHWFKCDKDVLRDLLKYNEVLCSPNRLGNS